MADKRVPTTGQLFAINTVGAVGLIFGALAIVNYLLGLEVLAFSTAPYDWLALEGASRYLPPAMVLIVCFVLAWWLERRATT